MVNCSSRLPFNFVNLGLASGVHLSRCNNLLCFGKNFCLIGLMSTSSFLLLLQALPILLESKCIWLVGPSVQEYLPALVPDQKDCIFLVNICVFILFSIWLNSLSINTFMQYQNTITLVTLISSTIMTQPLKLILILCFINMCSLSLVINHSLNKCHTLACVALQFSYHQTVGVVFSQYNLVV